MSRTKNEFPTFTIGDKVKLISNPTSEGVIVHRYSAVTDNREWSVHWDNIELDRANRGIYSSVEIKKYY